MVLLPDKKEPSSEGMITGVETGEGAEADVGGGLMTVTVSVMVTTIISKTTVDAFIGAAAMATVNNATHGTKQCIFIWIAVFHRTGSKAGRILEREVQKIK
jgi:hypothetical protein